MNYRVGNLRPSAILLLSVAGLCFAPRPAAAQIHKFSSISVAERDRLFEQLADDVESLEQHLGIFKRVVKLVAPSVVHIEAAKIDSSTRRSVSEAGSGVIVDLGERNYVLTNRHVVKDTPLEDIEITLADGRTLTPKKVWADDGTDVAVMWVEATNLIPARLGDSNGLEIGEYVLAMGSPYGLSHSVSRGIVSAMHRHDLELGNEGVRFQNFIQTDAAINPGNSGGPLINLRGEVVGINTAIASSSGANEGVGFSIPMRTAVSVAKQLVERGYVSRAFLGVNLDVNFTPAAAARIGLPAAIGARVSGITPDSPAARADLEIGDVIIEFDGVRIDDHGHLVTIVGLTEVGRDVPIVVYRDRKAVRMSVQVGDRSKFSAER